MYNAKTIEEKEKSTLSKNRSLDFRDGRIGIDLVVVAGRQDGAVGLAAERAAQQGQVAADRDNVRLEQALGADGGGPQVRDVEPAADAHEAPEARLADEGEGHGRGPVKERGDGAAVHVAARVVVALVHGEGKGDARVRTVGLHGEKLDKGRDAALPVLGEVGWLSVEGT